MTLLLNPLLNEKLLPKLMRELKPGARIVSLSLRFQQMRKPYQSLFDIGPRKTAVYMWTVAPASRKKWGHSADLQPYQTTSP